jgi:hypothetical protein
MSIIGGGVCQPDRESGGRREVMPPEPAEDPRVGDSTIPNERRHRWSGPGCGLLDYTRTELK